MNLFHVSHWVGNVEWIVIDLPNVPSITRGSQIKRPEERETA
jgi:hypothetical protein